MSDAITKVIRDGKVAVLYSPGFGAGWFSWNRETPACLFDPEVVRMVEEGRPSREIEAYAEKWTTEDRGFYAGGARDLRVMWLPEGTAFRVGEYDGSESIETRDGTEWSVA